jgi:hypothetical protein
MIGNTGNRTHSRFRSLAASAAIGGVVLGIAVGAPQGNRAFAQVALPPGTTSGIPVPIISPGAPPFGGTLLLEVIAPLNGTNNTNTISGTVTSAVFRSTEGFLDFAYQFTFDNDTNIVVDAVSISSFSNVNTLAIAQTGDDVDGAGGLPAQELGGATQNNFTAATATGSFSSASRPNVNGDGINATLLTGVTRNETTFTLLVRTQATNFSRAGSASVQGGGISAFTASQGALTALALPANAPEPSALALLGMGLAAPVTLALARRRRRRNL